jgi:hypothetical protein
MKILTWREIASGSGNYLLRNMLTYRPLSRFYNTSHVRGKRTTGQTGSLKRATVFCDNYLTFL